RVSQGGLPDGMSLAKEPAAEVVEAVVGTAAVDQVGGPPQVPTVGLGHELAVDTVPGQHLVNGSFAQPRDQLVGLGPAVAITCRLGCFYQGPELLAVHTAPLCAGGIIHRRCDRQPGAGARVSVRELLQ